MTEILHIDGSRERVDGPLSLHDFQNVVGGLIELVYLPGKQFLVVNEEGLLLGLPTNMTASNIAGRHLVGTAILTDELE
jgi:hypothetical protein